MRWGASPPLEAVEHRVGHPTGRNILERLVEDAERSKTMVDALRALALGFEGG